MGSIPKPKQGTRDGSTGTKSKSKPNKQSNDSPDPRGIYQHRSSVVRMVCTRNNVTNTSFPVDRRVIAQLYVQHSHRFIYCEVPKVGCSNWKRIILTLNDSQGPTIKAVNHYELHKMALRYRLSSYPLAKQKELLANYTKVIFTRHPLQRVVSAYRDKFLHDDDVYYSQSITRHIRRKLGIKVNSTANLTFQQFVRFLVTENPEALDTHWKPMYQLCDPCSIHYHIIGRFESINQDSNFVLRTIGAPEGLRYPEMKHHSNDSRTDHDISNQYLETLPPDLLRKLQKLYSIDFSMFEYDY
ncbi:carbohydrate sulfotransferase 8-like [Gastrophryne carolinensis]